MYNIRNCIIYIRQIAFCSYLSASVTHKFIAKKIKFHFTRTYLKEKRKKCPLLRQSQNESLSLLSSLNKMFVVQQQQQQQTVRLVRMKNCKMWSNRCFLFFWNAHSTGDVSGASSY